MTVPRGMVPKSPRARFCVRGVETHKMNIRELRERRATAWAEMQNITMTAEGDNRRLTADEIKRWDGFERELTDATDELHVAEGTRAYSSGGTTTAVDMADPSMSLTDMHTTAGTPVLRSAQRLSSLPPSDGSPYEPSVGLDTIVRAVITGDWSKVPPEERAMSIGTPSAGGFAVPEALSSRIIDRARNQARVLQAGALTVPMESNTLKLARRLCR